MTVGKFQQTRDDLVVQFALTGGLDERREHRFGVGVFLGHLEDLFEVALLELTREQGVVEHSPEIGEEFGLVDRFARGEQLLEEQRGVRQVVRFHVAVGGVHVRELGRGKGRGCCEESERDGMFHAGSCSREK